MLIPSIDLMEGRAVQLRRGRERIVTSDKDPITLAEELNTYGTPAVIDLDAAMGIGRRSAAEQAQGQAAASEPKKGQGSSSGPGRKE